MALKFLNKKGWHTGSLRNIENVWKAEQKHEAEQNKLEELRKQIQEERERTEFRQLQEQAGLVPKQERLEFLYDSGLSVGRGSSSGIAFKALETSVPKTDSGAASSQPLQTSVPGALFEEKQQSANDAWRKLHSDPLLLIRQKEQEALARVKNNPIQMAMIRKSVKDAKNTESGHYKDDEKESRKKHQENKYSSRRNHSDFETSALKLKDRRKTHGAHSTFESSRRDRNDRVGAKRKGSGPEGHREFGCSSKEKTDRSFYYDSSSTTRKRDASKHQNSVKLSDEERAARLREMQIDADLHEEQRWKRLKKAEEIDSKEALYANPSGGRSFLDGVQKRAYGTSNEGSSTIEESVRRRTHYLQGKSEAAEGNAFRRI